MSTQVMTDTPIEPTPGFTGSPELFAKLHQALVRQIAAWGLTFHAEDAVSGAYVAGYGYATLAEDLAWAVRLRVTEAAHGSSLRYDAAPMAHYPEASDWEWLQHLHRQDGESDLPVTPTWTTPRMYVDAADACPENYLEAVKRTVLRHADYLKRQRAAQARADVCKASFGADTEGHFQQNGVAGTVVTRAGEVELILQVTTQDPDKARAILAIMGS